eukprot:tig00021036_g17306.t1
MSKEEELPGGVKPERPLTVKNLGLESEDRHTHGKEKPETFCIRYSMDGVYVAAGYGDGVIKIFNAESGKLSYELVSDGSAVLPITCLRFRPYTAQSKTKNVLLATGADGTVKHWHITSGKCLHTITEEDNQVYALDYRYDGLKFITAGQDFKVRLYDEATKTLVQELAGGYGKARPGHSNRVFSLKPPPPPLPRPSHLGAPIPQFVPNNEHLFISGGWDNTIQNTQTGPRVWDMRVDYAVRSIFGAHICGDAVDVQGDEVLTGSWRPKDQLQVWDLGTTALVKTIPFTANPFQQAQCLLYTAQFSGDPAGSMVVAGGSGRNEVKIFNRSSGAILGSVTGLEKGVYTACWAPDVKSIAFAGGEGRVRIADL